MNIKKEEFLRNHLKHYVSENIVLHSKSFDSKELTPEEFKSESERLTRKLLNNIDFIMNHM